MHKVEFNVISADQYCSKGLVLFGINNLNATVRNTEIGQLIESKSFELNYPTSIGKSTWVLIAFLNGQYDYGGTPNEYICVYLKLIKCEYPSKTLKCDVKFTLGIRYASLYDQIFCYENVKTRWVGTKLIKTTEMIINGSQFNINDTLLLQMDLDQCCSKESAAPWAPIIFEENYNYESKTENCDKNVVVDRNNSGSTRTIYNYTNVVHDSNRNIKTKYCDRDETEANSSSVSDSYVSSRADTVSYKSNQSVDMYDGNQNVIANSYKSSDPTHSPVQPANNKTIICDSTLSYVDNEFSDEDMPEEKPVNRLDKFKKIITNFFK